MGTAAWIAVGVAGRLMVAGFGVCLSMVAADGDEKQRRAIRQWRRQHP